MHFYLHLASASASLTHFFMHLASAFASTSIDADADARFKKKCIQNSDHNEIKVGGILESCYFVDLLFCLKYLIVNR